MVLDVGGLDGQKRARTDMERKRMDRNSAFLQPRGELLGKMQTGGGRCNRAPLSCEEGLIVAAVAVVRRAARRNVVRKRHGAALLDCLIKHRTVKREGERDLSALAFVLDGRVKLAEEADLALFAETDDIAHG